MHRSSLLFQYLRASIVGQTFQNISNYIVNSNGIFILLMKLYLLKYMSAFSRDFIAGIQLFVSKQIKVVLVLESIVKCESKAGFCSKHPFSRNITFSDFTFLYCFYFLLSILNIVTPWAHHAKLNIYKMFRRRPGCLLNIVQFCMCPGGNNTRKYLIESKSSIGK